MQHAMPTVPELTQLVELLGGAESVRNVSAFSDAETTVTASDCSIENATTGRKQASLAISVISVPCNVVTTGKRLRGLSDSRASIALIECGIA